jgi:3',5'-cyclic AMP phosphodiesterase CpdA
MRYTLMQISDLHAGAPFRPEVAEAVRQQAHELRPDLLVVSGDLVQRAVVSSQWRTITSFLETLPHPQLIVPGNHDVPLFDGFSRIFAPLRYYQRHISSEINPRFERPGLAVVGGNSSHGLTMDGGYVGRRQRAALQSIFDSYGNETCKVAVLHHPVIAPPGTNQTRRIMSNARATLELLERCNVELYLCGHVHFSYIDFIAHQNGIEEAMATRHHGIIISQSGTTTSRRGRGIDRAKNSFNLIEIDEQHIRICPHFFEPGPQRFIPMHEHTFTRRHAVGA